MSKLTINASSEFLNEFEWYLQRLCLQAEIAEGLAVSMRDLHKVLSLLLEEAKIKR